MAERSPLSEVRFRAHPRSEPQEDALLVHRLPVLFQCQDRHRDAGIQSPASQVGNRHLFVSHQLEVGLQHEAATRHRCIAAYGVVHVAPHSGSVGREGEGPFDGPVEFDETYVGGKRKNMSNAKRKAATGRGPVDMVAVIGAKDRATNKVNAKVIESTDKDTLHDFVADNADPDAVVYTDDAAAYEGIPNPHESVKHSVSEYVNGMAHTNGIESFWSMLKRAHKGTFHKISPKHLQRYVSEFSGKHNVRDSGTLVQMRDTVAQLVGRNLLYRDLIADNGLASGSGA